jgi:catechol 2,3-dioxygenase-like lactoylglutathione lyase family enzyme
MALGSISLITVAVTDQERAKAFYVDRLGFTVKFDYAMEEGNRWIMLTPPGGGADITLANWFDDLRPGSAKLSLTCDDVDATFAELTGRGVRANNEVTDAPWGRWFGFDDPDGNNWLVVQQPTGSGSA